jgi:sugar phosphate isomerase/epimerase
MKAKAIMQIGAVSLGWCFGGRDIPLPALLGELAAAGGECVEINGKPGRHAGLTLDEANAPDVKRWATEAGLTITGVSGYSDFTYSDPALIDVEIERLLGSCRLAAALDVTLVRAFAGDVRPEIDFAGVRPYMVDAFRSAAEQAAALGTTLAIENHGRLVNDGAQLVSLLTDIDAPNVGITLDTGNFAWAGHSPEENRADFAAVLPYVLNVHIKDGNWRGDQFELTPAGDGELDLAALLSDLYAQGYAGPILSEYEGSGDFIAATRRSIAFLKSAWQAAIQ